MKTLQLAVSFVGQLLTTDSSSCMFQMLNKNTLGAKNCKVNQKQLQLPGTSLCIRGGNTFQFPLPCSFRFSEGSQGGCCPSFLTFKLFLLYLQPHVFLIPPLYHRLMMLFYLPINKLTIMSWDNVLRSAKLSARKKSRHK